MRRVPAVVAGAVGFAGIIAFHSGDAPSILGSRSPVSTATTTTPGSKATTTTSSAASPAPRTAVGNSEQYGYGVLAVKVTVTGRHITDVSVASIQTAEQYSQSLAQQVIPTLKDEVMAAQSAHINAISGATYTSEAYAYSLQSALDRLGVK